MDKLRETQEAYQTMSHRLSQIETDNAILLRQLQALLSREEVGNIQHEYFNCS